MIKLKQNHQQNLAGISQVSDGKNLSIKTELNSGAGIVKTSVQFD